MEICVVGGYNEVGKNMTALTVNNDAIILDMGFHLPSLIDFEESGGSRKNVTRKGLINMGAIPNDSVIESWRKKVRAIALGHCHLDHIGAVPYLANKYNCGIYGTPYTIEVLRGMMRDDRQTIRNELNINNVNSVRKINKDISIEFIAMTHSTLQTTMMAVHTKKGTILYANDFKFDNHPVLGNKPNYKRLRELGNENIIALVVDSLYAGREQKTPSEKVAREMLKDVMLGTENTNNAIFVTCFASHLARIKSIVDFGERLGRRIIFLGRSLKKYSLAAETIGLIDFSKRAEIRGYRRQAKKMLNEIEKNRKDYLVVCTGGQGEPGAILTSIAENSLPFKFKEEDHIIFSNKVIPTDINKENRAKLEASLKSKHARIFKDLHTSGHASREDLRDLIKLTRPDHLIPAHGEQRMLNCLKELALEMGYKDNKVHVMRDGQKIKI